MRHPVYNIYLLKHASIPFSIIVTIIPNRFMVFPVETKDNKGPISKTENLFSSLSFF